MNRDSARDALLRYFKSPMPQDDGTMCPSCLTEAVTPRQCEHCGRWDCIECAEPHDPDKCKREQEDRERENAKPTAAWP